MALTRKQKEKSLEDLKEKISKQKAMVLVGITGLKMKDISDLRKELKKNDANLKVVKKTLAEIALKENNFDFNKDKYKEELGFIFGFGDELFPVKTAYRFSKENENLKILGGFFEGNLIEKEEVVSLANLPSKEVLLAKLVGAISAPMSNMTYALNYNLKGLLYALKQIKA